MNIQEERIRAACELLNLKRIGADLSCRCRSGDQGRTGLRPISAELKQLSPSPRRLPAMSSGLD